MLYIGEAGQAAALTYETGAIGFNKLNPSARNSAKMGKVSRSRRCPLRTLRVYPSGMICSARNVARSQSVGLDLC